MKQRIMAAGVLNPIFTALSSEAKEFELSLSGMKDLEAGLSLDISVVLILLAGVSS